MYPGSTAYGTTYYDSTTRESSLCNSCTIRLTLPKVLLLLSAGVEFTIIGFSGVLFLVENVPTSSVDVTASYTINICVLILLIASIFSLFRGLFAERKNELYAFLAILTTLTIYILIDYYMTCIPNATYRSVLKFTVGVGTPITAILTKWTASRFVVGRIVGAADSLRFMYEARCNLLVVLRLENLFMIIFGLLSYSLNDAEQHLGYFTTSVIISLAMLKWLIARTALIKEVKAMVYVHVTLSIIGNLWIPIQLLLVSCYFPEKCSHSRIEYSYLTLIAGLFVVGIEIMSFILLLKVFRNFGYGLTDRDFVRLLSESTSLLGPNRNSRTLNF